MNLFGIRIIPLIFGINSDEIFVQEILYTSKTIKLSSVISNYVAKEAKLLSS